MKKITISIALAALLVLGFAMPATRAQNGDAISLCAHLDGLTEVPPNATGATADFTATINSDGSFPFTLDFQGLTANAAVAHLHFAPPKVAGGVMIFLCGGGGQPACPAATSGHIDGTITAANVTGPTAQGINAGELQKAIQTAILTGNSYANIHNSRFPGGEIRGDVNVGGQ